MIGQTISNYKILKKLGEGGMGLVYKVNDLKLTIFILGCISILLLNPLLYSQESTPPTLKQEIQSVLDKQAQAWNKGNIEGYMQGYWKSDSLLFTSGGKIQRGWKSTFEKYKKSYDTKEKMGMLKFSQLEINRLSNESAWVFGHWELERKGDHPNGVFTLILRKFSDGWKIIHDHTSKE